MQTMNRKKYITVIPILMLLLVCVSACQAEICHTQWAGAIRRSFLAMETIRSIAEAHGVSSAQVILRWDLQRGIVVIPGSSDPEHIKENLDLFGFELSDEEMAAIRALDRNEKHDWY